MGIMGGYARRTLRVGITVALLASCVFGQDSTVSCETELEKMRAFERLLWEQRALRTLPSFGAVVDRLRVHLLRSPKLDPPMRHAIERGGSPLRWGNRDLLLALAQPYFHAIESAKGVSGEEKKALEVALSRAVDDLASGLAIENGDFVVGVPPGQTGGGPGGSGGFGGGDGDSFSNLWPIDFPLNVPAYFREAAFRKCVKWTTSLFIVSNVINTLFALQAKWEQYSGTRATILNEKIYPQSRTPHSNGLLSMAGNTWKRAWADPDFQHNVLWNTLLMVTLGVSECLNNKSAGTRLMLGVSGATSVADQLMMKGDVSIPQLLLDVAFIRLVTINKFRLVIWLSNSYRHRGLPFRYPAELLMLATSEGVGGFLYPRTVSYSRTALGEMFDNFTIGYAVNYWFNQFLGDRD